MATQLTKELTIAERTSYVQSPTRKEVGDDYDQLKSPAALEDGALRAGGPPVYNSPEILALYAQYACVGIVMGGIGGMRYPILNIYFSLEANTLSAASGLMTLGWSLKVFYGMLSDCLPIFGYSRKPYILLGWVLTAICFSYIAIKPAGDPLDPTSSEEAQKHAQSQGSLLALLCTIACFCYIMADVSCDAMVVEYAQREPANVRGRLQASIYSIRTVASISMTAISGFLLNSKRMGGSFTFDIGVNWYFAIVAIPVTLNIPIVWFFLQDTKKEKVVLSAYFAQVYTLIKKRVVWQVMIFNFLFALFSGGIYTTASGYVPVYWAKVETLNQAISGILSSLIFAGVLVIVGKWGTQWNWRLVIAITTFLTNAIDAIVQYITIYDIYRNQWFYLGVPLTEMIPLGIQFVVSTFVIVELAEKGNEGLMYGLLTTITHLPSIFGTMITNVYCTQFKVGRKYIKADTLEVRNDVAATYGIMYATTIISCFCVFLLPSQKAQVAALKKDGGSYPLIGTSIIVLVFIILSISITSTMLSMFPSTQCLLLAGGQGC